MGWTYYETCGNKDRKELCRREYGNSPSWATIVKDELIDTVYFAAMKDTDTGEVWGLVVLTDFDGSLFGYKGISEESYPYYFNCPLNILELLSPTDNENAIEWRKHCYAYHGKEYKNTGVKI